MPGHYRPTVWQNTRPPTTNAVYPVTPNQTMISLTPPSVITEILKKHNFKNAKGTDLFGYSFFEAARYGIEARRLVMNNGTYLPIVDAGATPIGPPLWLNNIFIPAPGAISAWSW